MNEPPIQHATCIAYCCIKINSSIKKVEGSMANDHSLGCRSGLLVGSLAVLLGLIAVSLASILYVNLEQSIYSYLLAASSAFLVSLPWMTLKPLCTGTFGQELRNSHHYLRPPRNREHENAEMSPRAWSKVPCMHERPKATFGRNNSGKAYPAPVEELTSDL